MIRNMYLCILLVKLNDSSVWRRKVSWLLFKSFRSVNFLSHFFLSLFYFSNSCAIFKIFDTPLPDLKNYNLCFQSWLFIPIFLMKFLKVPKRWANFPICHWKTLKKLVDLEVRRIHLVVEFPKKKLSFQTQ